MRHPQQWWSGDASKLDVEPHAVKNALEDLARPLFLIDVDGRLAVSRHGQAVVGLPAMDSGNSRRLVGMVPSLLPEELGDASFRNDHGLKYSYVVGAMANGITSVEMVHAAGRAGMIGFFGAGGLTLEKVEQAIDQIQSKQDPFPYGFNLIHSPNDPQLESAVVSLYLKRGIKMVSASAYLGLTLPLLHYRYKGIHLGPDGMIVCPNRVIAKVSRVEVARKFFAPPPDAMLVQLVDQGCLSEQEARLAKRYPVAQDMTAEADSGGHTDNRPAMTLLPTFLALRDECQSDYNFEVPLRVGLAGGIATPAATAAAFAMGAAYVLTGSINQSCLEADTSETVKQLLAQAKQADVTMAPAADMFELGAKVQVLKRGTMFAMRGSKLYELYRTYDDYYQIPEQIRMSIERDLLQTSFEQAWEQTCVYFNQCDPDQIRRAQKDSKFKMALVFRSYLGQSSLWAKNGEMNRVVDYQIWCGPAMGAFNAWVKSSSLEKPENRKTDVVGMNLLYGACVLTRAHWLNCLGMPVNGITVEPLPMEVILSRIADRDFN